MNINKVNLRTNGQLTYGNCPNKIILHHADMNGSIEDINQVHLNTGWCMIGYNFYVRKDGTVWEGRPVDAIGANCYGQNATSIGVCFEGNFMTDTMPDAQYNAGVELCEYLLQQYPNVKEINGHKHYYNTDCPGDSFPLDKMINAAMQRGIVSTVIALQNRSNTTAASSSSNLLKLWSTGDAVKDLQTKLNKLGYNLTVDGIFGQNTYNAVEDFQAKHGLTIDGIVGPETMAALNAANTIDIGSYKFLQHELNVQCGAGLAEDNIPGALTLAACPIIKITAQGNITKWIQNRLGINADGIFGNQTKIAVQNFQASHGLVADGVIGQNTWRALLGL